MDTLISRYCYWYSRDLLPHLLAVPTGGAAGAPGRPLAPTAGHSCRHHALIS
jgi:hypothetical protein